MGDGLVGALDRWLATRQNDPRAFAIGMTATVCEKYPEVLAARPVADTDKRLESVIAATDSGRLATVRPTDLEIGLLNILDDRRISGRSDRSMAMIDEARRRGSRRAYKSIFRCFLATFSEGSTLTGSLSSYLEERQDLAGSMRRLFSETRFFSGDHGLDQLTAFVVNGSAPRQLLGDLSVTPAVLASRYGWALKRQALRIAIAQCSEMPDRLSAVLDWLQPSGQRLLSHEAELFELVLSPFTFVDPAPAAKRMISKFLISSFGDPRVVRWPPLPGDVTGERATACLVVFKRWLAVEQLELFIRIIDRTAVERMWRARREFWKPYFDQGLISDATMILATLADREARRIHASSDELSFLTWCTLTGADPKHSVLLIKLDRLTIAEWSHNGKMRFWIDGDGPTPGFHKTTTPYSRAELTTGSSMVVVHRNGEASDGIVHYPDGTWQRRAAFVINNLTGATR